MTGPLIPITGIDASYRVPGSYAELLFNQGPATASAGVRTVVLVMPMLSGGTWTPGTLYQVTSESVAEQGAGSGSPLHRAARKALTANKSMKLYALPVAETSGGTPIAATATATLAGTATATGTAVVTVCGEDCNYTFSTGATPTAIAAGLVLAIAAKTWLPVTASNSAGVLTLTAKLKGISQGTASLGVIRVRGSVTAGVGITLTLSGAYLGSALAGVEGSSTEAANLATALLTIANTRRYYLVTSANDATSLTNLKTHVASKSEPKQGLRSVIVAGYTGSAGNAATLAVGKNYERLQIAWQRNSDHDSAEIAANVAAVRQKREQTDSAFNFAGYSDADWLINPAYDMADWISADESNSAINDGVTPIASRDGGSSIVMSVNTRSKNSTGTVADFRDCETHRVSAADEFVDELLVGVSLNFQGQKLKDDEFLVDGSVNTNQKATRGVLRPSYLQPAIYKQFDDYEDAGKLQAVAASKASLRLVKSPANSSRIECGFDLHVIDHAHQFTFRVAEVSNG